MINKPFYVSLTQQQQLGIYAAWVPQLGVWFCGFFLFVCRHRGLEELT